MRTNIQLTFLLAAVLATAPASAALYKWVDEGGVTNYSNERPADPKARQKMGRIENRMSSYTPDQRTLKATEIMRNRLNQTLGTRPAEPPPVAYEMPPQSAYDQCIASGQLGCDTLANSYYAAYYPGYYPRGLATRTGLGQQNRFDHGSKLHPFHTPPAYLSRRVPR